MCWLFTSEIQCFTLWFIKEDVRTTDQTKKKTQVGEDAS